MRPLRLTGAHNVECQTDLLSLCMHCQRKNIASVVRLAESEVPLEHVPAVKVRHPTSDQDGGEPLSGEVDLTKSERLLS
jgi:hypothetical protein